MEEGTPESLYGLSVRRATPEEIAQEGNQRNFIDGITGNSMGGRTQGHNNTRLIKGLFAAANTGASLEVED